MPRSLLFILFLLISFAAICQPYRYLVMKGGGIRGIAYAGALKVLEEKNLTQGIEKVAGTSVGAITGVLFSVGYSANELEKIMLDLDIDTFNDGEWYFIGGQKRLREKFGWYKGKLLEEWIGRQVKEQTGDINTTFMQLHKLAMADKKFKDLYVTATNLSKQCLEVFSWETFPDMPLRIAVRASASIPLYFGAVFIDNKGRVIENPKKDGYYNVYVDGGLLSNYPITIFNKENNTPQDSISQYTLGLRLERPEQITYQQHNPGIAPYDIHTFNGYMGALYNVVIEQLNRRIPYEEEKKHTIYISTNNLSPRVRHITVEEKHLLYKNGEDATKAFFEAAR